SDCRAPGLSGGRFNQPAGATRARAHLVAGTTIVSVTPIDPNFASLRGQGGDRSKGSGVLCPGEHHLAFKFTRPGGWLSSADAARSWKNSVYAPPYIMLVCTPGLPAGFWRRSLTAIR